MKWFNRNIMPSDSGGKDKVAKGIAGIILKLQQGFAKVMNKGAAKLSSTTMKVSLIFFLSFGTSLSFYFIVASFIKDEPSRSMKIDRIVAPRNIYKSGDDIVQRYLIITKDEYQEMKRFTDSLQGSEAYDSIVTVRPGLLDSVKELESIYENKK